MRQKKEKGKRRTRKAPFFEKGEKPIRAYPPMKNPLFQGRRLPKPHQITSLFRVRISTLFLTEKSPFWGAILAPWTPQGPLFWSKWGDPLWGEAVFFKSAFGGPPLGAQSDPKGRPRTPQGRPKVTFWPLLDHFGSLFGGF